MFISKVENVYKTDFENFVKTVIMVDKERILKTNVSYFFRHCQFAVVVDFK